MHTSLKVNSATVAKKVIFGGSFLVDIKEEEEKTTLSFILKTFFLSFSSKAGGRKLLAPGASFLTLALPLCYEL